MEQLSSLTEDMIFQILDKCKFLFFPEQWNPIFPDFSKNEVFGLLFIYRNKAVTMTETAAYLQVPLNTVTGVIGRLEKKKLLVRQRNNEDKRVVTVSMTDTGLELMQTQIRELTDFASQVMQSLDDNEKQTALKIVAKAMEILLSKSAKDNTGKNGRGIKRIIIE